MMHFPESFPVSLVYLKETESTNKYLNDLCNKQCVGELTTVTTDFQTSGRGQRGNSWESERGQNLMFSFVLYPAFLKARKQFLLSQIISLAIKEELDTHVSDVSIKWPNDIYWKDKKICGMLIENDLTGTHISRSIAGIGININQEAFTSPAPNNRTILQPRTDIGFYHETDKRLLCVTANRERKCKLSHSRPIYRISFP